jgi:K+-transporting ATPase ATPase C chain
MNIFLTSSRLFLWMTFVTGIAYPMLILIIGAVGFNNSRNGAIIELNGKPVGMKLIGQSFKSDRYFFGRPSHAEYDPLYSGGSNLGATSLSLRNTIKTRKKDLEHLHIGKKVPSELLFASGSGLDPHISLESAYYQIDRIINSRKLEPVKGKQLIEKLLHDLTEHQFLSFEKPYINVLLLNIALDKETLL